MGQIEPSVSPSWDFSGELACEGTAGWRGPRKNLANANRSQYHDSDPRTGAQPLSEHELFPPSRTTSPESGRPAGQRRIASRELFGEAAVVLIDHEGETYSLRRTRLGKLILTK
ncbi:MAG: hemin uptake protein HemP [Betaproteobacteria bacterium]|nr:hemin uptake protein HemP [Betaproteobacteria bacterium]